MVSYILDADIRSFFTEVSQQWVVRFLEHRIGDKRIIRLVQKWLRAGILEDGIVTIEEKGTGQGSVISPLLSNIYLHYVFDLWAERWRRREATGDVIMVRYADDTVVGFQHESDARRFRDAMRDRLREFSLSLHPEKTRLIEFGRFAAQNCKRRGRCKPETFKFLGFVLICDKSRRGDFRIRRKSRRDRMCAKLREIKEGLRHRMHRPIPETGKWLAQIVAGYFAYHAVPTNSPALSAFRYHVLVLWHRQVCRRSQRARMQWTRMTKLADEFLPPPRVPASLAKCALCRQTPEVGAECPNWARSDLCGGRSAMGVPTANHTGEGRCPCHTWVPVFEGVRKFTIGWISAVRPSRQLLRSFLRMRDFLNAIKGFPHAEEHPKGASRSTHGRDAANFLTASLRREDENRRIPVNEPYESEH